MPYLDLGIGKFPANAAVTTQAGKTVTSDISEGDVLDMRLTDNKIIIEPYKLIPSSQAYFWSKETQEDMLEAREYVKAGRMREFSNIDEFLKGLQDD
ncbi:hypothetical protein [Tepidanaerobacter acetatoxydans]|uniref:hypothetical protein n=1 Tax=Tepidanaerobacter acetatoxydans TaxID=499229 RepID=UPI00020BF6BC|nr:hypothetical protein [Tepidanaerobacter acetatoxydans]AEE90244.1 hypothetical protein TepRe1_0029 [Tepidanaerobacter acetatoxydans Re1]